LLRLGATSYRHGYYVTGPIPVLTAADAAGPAQARAGGDLFLSLPTVFAYPTPREAGKKQKMGDAVNHGRSPDDWTTGILECCGGDGYGKGGDSAGSTVCKFVMSFDFRDFGL
jgi:hypothetical protein